MAPTIQTGDHFASAGIKSDALFELKRFDVVVYRRKPDPSRGIDDSFVFVHRIVGMPGEKIEIRNGVVFVNDSELVESTFQKRPFSENQKAVVVPPNEFYLLGDNRAASEDSRYIGTVPREKIDGIVSNIIRKADYDAGKRW